MYRCSLFCSFYRGGKFIKHYIENMYEQSIFKDIEFIFLDCNSPDNEWSNYISKLHDPNIKYYRLDSDPGLYAAWNIAVKHCTSPIIGNWNIDDRKNKDGVEIMLHKFDLNPSIDVLYGITYVSNVANERYIDNSYDQIYPVFNHSFENLMRHNSPHCMPLWKRELHDKFGYFDESYKTASDGDFWLRCAVGGSIIQMMNHPVGLYYENPTGRSTNPETLQDMVREVYQMRLKYIKHLQQQKN